MRSGSTSHNTATEIEDSMEEAGTTAPGGQNTIGAVQTHGEGSTTAAESKSIFSDFDTLMDEVKGCLEGRAVAPDAAEENERDSETEAKTVKEKGLIGGTKIKLHISDGMFN